MIDYQNIDELVADICNADTVMESFLIYNQHHDKLAGWRFVFSSDTGPMPGFAVERQFTSGAMVCSLFSDDKVLVLDAVTLNEMTKGQSQYPYDYSISLDTQAISYLEPYLSGKRTRLPKDYGEVFEFIARDDVNIDPMPYMLENHENLADSRKLDKIFNKLKAYEVLRTLDTELLKNSGEIASVLSDQELESRTQASIAKLIYDAGNPVYTAALKMRHNIMYCLLLKMVEINLSNGKASLESKIDKFMGFMDEKLSTIYAREAIVAKEYFEQGQRLKFFGKIQKGNDDVLDNLKNMAWDFWHIRQGEEALTFKFEKGVRYHFPAFLTFDKRLLEIIKLYALKSCALPPSGNQPIPFYRGDWITEMSKSYKDTGLFITKYFSDSARAERERKRDKATSMLNALIKDLEEQVLKLTAVVEPA